MGMIQRVVLQPMIELTSTSLPYQDIRFAVPTSGFKSAMAWANARQIGQRALQYADVEKVLKSTVEFQVYMNQNKELAQRQNWR